MKSQAVKIAVILIGMLSAVSGCGGGSDGSQAPPPRPIGGITRTGIAMAVGPVTGFGSVNVNGISYDTSTATFTVDGQAATQAELKIGQVVFIRGTIDDDNTNAVADSVEYEDIIEGPVTAVVNDATILVLGSQTVHIGGAIFDDSCPATLPELLTLAAVEVSGSVLADGSINASYIDCKAVLDGDLELNGVVESLGADTFMINQVVVNFTENPAAIDNFPSGSISEDDPVEVKGTQVNASNEFVATRVEFKGARFDGDDGDHFEVDGYITNFASSRSFMIGPFSITTDDDTTYEGGAEGDLGPNIKIEVEGDRDGNSILATHIEFKRATHVRLEGLVFFADMSPSFVMNGVTVTTEAGQTSFRDRTGVVLPADFGSDDIMTGNFLEVRGQEFPAGTDELFAVIVERDDVAGFDPDESIIRGFVETVGTRDLTVLGVTIMTVSGTTQYEDANDQPVTEDFFWNNLVGVDILVKAKGTISGGGVGGTTLTADELEIEN